MARVTVEDCILKIPNRFKLVMMAAQRSRDLSGGIELTVDRDNDKNPVVALREIADETVPLEEIEASLVRGLQKHVDVDEPGEEGDEFLAVEDALSEYASGAKTGMELEDSDDPLARALAGAAFEDIDDDDDEMSAEGAEGDDEDGEEEPE